MRRINLTTISLPVIIFLILWSLGSILNENEFVKLFLQHHSGTSIEHSIDQHQHQQQHQQQQQQRPKIQEVAIAKDDVNNTNNATPIQQGGGNNDNNINSQLALEVESIHHIQAKRQIIVNLRQEGICRRCRDPKLFGRLSGPYVTLIKWETETTTYTNTTLCDDDNDNDNNQMLTQSLVGTYSLPSSGKYFIEVISLFCNGPQWNASFQNVCMEDPTSHRLTEDTAFIDVINVTASALGGNYLYGYWKRSNNETTSSTKTAIPAPLLTRYQPQQCRSRVELDSDLCQATMSRERFDPYQFQFIANNNNKDDMDSRIQSQLLAQQQQQQGEEPLPPMLLCFIGLSHAREMSHEVSLWLEKWNVTSVVQSINIDAQFPRFVNTHQMQRYGCNVTVIAAGQWSAGRKPPGGRFRGIPPTTFDEYEFEVRDMILRLSSLSSSSNKIYLRSIHYNALGDVKTSCPPQDWRSPPVIDTYNDIIRNLSSSMNISYIDTNFIVGPLWDISEDFCHYRLDKVASAEALYMLSRMLLSP